MHRPASSPKIQPTSSSDYFARPARNSRGRAEARGGPCEPQSPYDDDDKDGVDEAHLCRPARPSPARVRFDVDEDEVKPMSPGRDEMATRGRSNVRNSSRVRSQRPTLGRAVLYHCRGPLVT